MGLRGTGSIDYTITDAFVPEDYTHFAFTREPLHGGSLYRLGIIGIAVVCHSGWAMGVGRRLLDELSELVRTKKGRPGSLIDTDAFRTNLAKTEARFRSATASSSASRGPTSRRRSRPARRSPCARTP